MFQKKHKNARANWQVAANFPDSKVAEAYLKPAASRNPARFPAPEPKLHRARAFCRDMLGWTEQEMDAQIDPVIQRFVDRTTQTRVDSFFMTYNDNLRGAKFSSARLSKSVELITGTKTNLSSLHQKEKRKRQRKKTVSASASDTVGGVTEDGGDGNKKRKSPAKRKKKQKEAESEEEEFDYDFDDDDGIDD